MKRTIFSLSLLASAASAYATVYYWTGTDAYLDYGTVENWKLESADGETATALPGASDTYYGCKNKYFDLGGGEYTIGGWDSTGNWNRYTMYLKNGTLNVAGNVTTHSDTIDLNDGATYNLLAGFTYSPAYGDASAHEIIVRSGATFNAYCAYKDYKTALSVLSGGKAEFNPSVYRFSGSSAQTSTFENQIDGELSFPKGLLIGDGTSANAALKITNAGTLKLGGGFDRNGKFADDTKFTFTISGGKVEAENSVAFSGVTCAITGNVEFAVAEAGAIDLTPFTISEVTLTKSGAGSLTLGSSLPSSLNITAGKAILGAAAEAASVTMAAGATLEFGAKGITVDSASFADDAVFTLTAGVFAEGDTIVTSTDEFFLAAVQTSLATTGASTTIEDGKLVMAASDLVFNSTTITDLTAAAGWKSGSVPVAGAEVAIAGAGVTATIGESTELPAWSSIRVKDGATLKIEAASVTAAIVLEGNAALEIAGETALAGGVSFTADGETIPSMNVKAGAALSLPGGTRFGNVALTLKGDLIATTSGDIVFGSAAADETALFSMTAEGTTIKPSAGFVNFICPIAGGTVKQAGDIIVKDTVIVPPSRSYGSNFGVNNSTAERVTLVFDNTVVTNFDFAAEIAGAVTLDFKNGGGLYRDDTKADATMTVSGLAKLVFEAGSTFYYGRCNLAGSEGNGTFSVSPDEDGWTAIEITDTDWEVYHPAGNSKGVVKVNGNCTRNVSVNTYNRADPFSGLKSVELAQGATLKIRNSVVSAVYQRSMVPFTGEGGMYYHCTGTRSYYITCPDNTATGDFTTCSDCNSTTYFRSGSRWGGKVIWTAKTTFQNPGATTAGTWTFGSLQLDTTMTLRVWEDKADKVVLTAGGFSGDGAIAISLQDGYEPAAGEAIVVGTMPADAALPASAGNWAFSTQAIEGDDTTVNLVVKPVSTDYVFNSTTVTDLTDPTAWACGEVPTGKEVRIEGEGVTAIVSGDNLPSFASIAVKNGATLKVTAEDVTLPTLALDATGALVVGDDDASASAVALTDLTTVAKVGDDDTVDLSRIVVKSGATLTVPAGTNFKNVSIELYGTISKAGGTDGEGVRFGYADADETTYFAMTSDGGTIDIHSNQNADNGRHHFLSPAEGGRVKAVGAITLKNVSLPIDAWSDWCDTRVGVNNPEDEPFDFVLDGTAFESSADCRFGGAVRVVVKNGAHIDRNSHCINHGFGDYVQDSARIVIEGEGAYLDHNIGGSGGNLYLNGKAAGEVTVQNGGTYYCQHTGGSGTGTLSVSNGFAKASKVHSDDKRTDFFKGFTAVNVEPESTLGLVADNTGSGGDSYDRIVKLADVPIIGSGDVFMRNDIADSKPFVVTVVNAANTCTGSIEVKNDSGEDCETSLRFADGANWAGTVVAGNISLTNLTGAAATASATFGTLKLAGDFPIRVLDSGCDKLAVGSVVNAGGKIVPLNADGETFKPEFGVKYEIMTIAAPAAGEKVTLPAIAKNWKVEAVTADDGTVKVMASLKSGLAIIVR